VRAQNDAESARAKAEASRKRAEKASGEAEKLWRKAERVATGEAEPTEGDGTEGASGREVGFRGGLERIFVIQSHRFLGAFRKSSGHGDLDAMSIKGSSANGKAARSGKIDLFNGLGR
jgi:hypothetical protein